MAPNPRPHRPVVRDPAALEALDQGSDPIAALHAAHETAAVLLHTGRAADDPALTERLVGIVDEIGLSTLAELWSQRPANSLPGALWRLYVLREWVRRDPDQAAREYGAGSWYSEPDHAVAGVDPTGPDEISQVADAILRGVFTGDFGVALERAAAFCTVIALGRAEIAVDIAGMHQALQLKDLSRDFVRCARLWRDGRLQ